MEPTNHLGNPIELKGVRGEIKERGSQEGYLIKGHYRKRGRVLGGDAVS